MVMEHFESVHVLIVLTNFPFYHIVHYGGRERPFMFRVHVHVHLHVHVCVPVCVQMRVCVYSRIAVPHSSSCARSHSHSHACSRVHALSIVSTCTGSQNPRDSEPERTH